MTLYFVCEGKELRKEAQNKEVYIDSFYFDLVGICLTEKDARILMNNKAKNTFSDRYFIVPIISQELILSKNDSDIKNIVDETIDDNKQNIIKRIKEHYDSYFERIKNGTTNDTIVE
jgi:hypothetical protein